jgi:hypothetical protein
MRQRRADMPRVRREDTPAYAVDARERAKPIGSQLAVAAGLLSVLLVAMTTVEAPLHRQGFAVDGRDEIERPPSDEPGLLCSVGGKIVSWIAVEAS